MAAKYTERKQYVKERKPYWLSLRHPRDGEMQFDLFNYFPDMHYREAVEQAGYHVDDTEEPEVRPDGGSRTQYYWSGEQGILYHSEQGEDMVVPFFDSVDDAERFLERQADQYGEDRYKGMVLRKTGNRKVEEATDVLTEQSGLADFAPDGGYPEPSDGLQVANPGPETVWFWYDPSVDHIVQEEVEPYDVRGLFETEGDAERFIEWYADRYDLDDTGHFELYSADLEYHGTGPRLDSESATDADDEREPPEQADLTGYSDDDDDAGGPDVMADGGIDTRELAKVKLERALSDPILAHGPADEYLPPSDDSVYDDIQEARLIQYGETPIEEPVSRASWPETLVYLHTVSFDGAYDTPDMERVFRHTFRQYIDEWTDHDLDDLDDHYTLADDGLSPELQERVEDLRVSLKQDRDRIYLTSNDLNGSVPASFWDVEPIDESN
ncbi:MAG: hypothetical protein SVU32_09105, partial [Candidatus Nanohaloarchaea archaeon]|nr:hypothetical protein [Candidatus Nanohaloarchaea archaeon]